MIDTTPGVLAMTAGLILIGLGGWLVEKIKDKRKSDK